MLLSAGPLKQNGSRPNGAEETDAQRQKKPPLVPHVRCVAARRDRQLPLSYWQDENVSMRDEFVEASLPQSVAGATPQLRNSGALPQPPTAAHFDGE
jgi:hypothetical protein